MSVDRGGKADSNPSRGIKNGIGTDADNFVGDPTIFFPFYIIPIVQGKCLKKKRLNFHK
jgi:hypothetical protein